MFVKREQRGFSLLETMIVVAITLIVAGTAVMSFVRALRHEQAESAIQFMKRELLAARANAVQTRSVYYVTFTAPGTIQTTSYITTSSTSVALPSMFSFDVETTTPTAPDGYGTASTAIDLGYGVTHNPTTAIYFYPDGSARDNLGRFNGGVIYVAKAGDITTAHAISIIGATGRVASWRLANVAGGYAWKED